MSPTMATKIETLKVPGAHLYYEIRGSGPVLLMMPGGPADATAFRSIAGQLAPHYTVVTYDPRGLSRSKLESPLDEERIVEVFAMTFTACWLPSPMRRPTCLPAAAAQ
jgi:pimeloyl-ACP methyl ester carboxylesterase